jgi:hypothetical protein
MATSFLPDDNGSTKRPDVISVLGLFTFINTGFFILLYLLGIMGMLVVARMPVDEFAKILHDAAGQYMPEEEMFRMDELAHLLHGSGVLLMAIYLVRTVVRLVGALIMFRGKKSGFYIYAVAQLLGLFVPHLVLPWSYLGVFGPLLAVAITAIYGSQLKRMS